MSVTIEQVARAAGVNRGTVDRVLHNRGGWIRRWLPVFWKRQEN